jgi:GNAT superfamily N-acetyltransferase
MGRMIALSPLDEARFGVRTAKVNDLTEACLPETLKFCEREAVRFLITRCPASDLPLVHRLEQAGFLLMDTLVYYRHKNLANTPDAADPEGIVIRPAKLGEEALVRSIAEQSFQGYQGHYHADPRLDPRHCDEAYIDWAVRSCEFREQGQSEVLVAASSEGLLGFATLRMETTDEGEGVLFCVAPAAQGKGIYRLFMIRGMEWSRIHGAKSMVVSTQVTNLAVQKAWVRLGFEPSGSYYTFHRWFD